MCAPLANNLSNFVSCVLFKYEWGMNCMNYAWLICTSVVGSVWKITKCQQPTNLLWESVITYLARYNSWTLAHRLALSAAWRWVDYIHTGLILICVCDFSQHIVCQYDYHNFDVAAIMCAHLCVYISIQRICFAKVVWKVHLLGEKGNRFVETTQRLYQITLKRLSSSPARDLIANVGFLLNAFSKQYSHVAVFCWVCVYVCNYNATRACACIEQWAWCCLLLRCHWYAVGCCIIQLYFDASIHVY